VGKREGDNIVHCSLRCSITKTLNQIRLILHFIEDYDYALGKEMNMNESENVKK
jgi:hypothetical protein